MFHTNTKYINHESFLNRSIHYDFGLGGTEVYFINVSKHIIYNNYDDRGLDVVATDCNTLKPLYDKYNDWILDYDRERIDKLFLKTESN